MDDLRLILVLCGVVFILGFVVQSMWQRRKRQQALKPRFVGRRARQASRFEEDYDDPHGELSDDVTDETFDEEDFWVDEEDVVLKDEIAQDEMRLEQREHHAHGSNDRFSASDTSETMRAFENENKYHDTAPLDDKPRAPAPQQIIAFHLTAKMGRTIQGHSLLPALISSGLRFGEMNIFHRYDQMNGAETVQFSLASLTEPGVFDIDNMESFTSTGLILFMTIPGPANEVKAFENMLTTARQLSRSLDIELRDSEHQLLTEKLIRQLREHIADRQHAVA